MLSRNFILVTGSSGWVGSHVCMQLQRRGVPVAGFDRIRPEGAPEAFFSGDLDCLAEPSSELVNLLRQTKAVIHCAGRAHRPVETAEEIQAFEKTNVGGTRDLASACLRYGVDRVVYVSTIAAYNWEQANGKPVSEDETLVPLTAYARTKLEGEALVSKSRLDWRVVRLATVFGEGDRANFAKLARGLKRRRFVVPGRGVARKSVIPIDVAAGILVEMALMDKPRHRLINAALPESPTLRQICDEFSLCCGFPKSPALPMLLMKAMGVGGTMISTLVKGVPLTADIVRKLSTSTIVDTRRMQETLPNYCLPAFRDAVITSANYYKGL